VACQRGSRLPTTTALSRKRSDELNVAAWGQLIEGLQSHLLERHGTGEPPFGSEHRREYLRRLGRIDVAAGFPTGGSGAMTPADDSAEPREPRPPADQDACRAEDHANVVDWAREISRTLVSGLAVLARCRTLTAPRMTEWLLAQADPLWRGLLQLAMGLVANRPGTIDESANPWSSPSGPLPGPIQARLDQLLVHLERSYPEKPRLTGADKHRIDEEDSWFITHFFEQLLSASDPSGRQRRGVYYTPREVVRRMVSDVDRYLCEEFGLDDGLADLAVWKQVTRRNPRSTNRSPQLPPDSMDAQPFLHVLDPAAGSGAFLVEVIAQIAARFPKGTFESNSHDKVPSQHPPMDLYLADRLPRLRGFECLLAACLVAQLNVAAKLAQVGFEFTTSFPPLVELRDTLAGPWQGTGPGMDSRESGKCLSLEVQPTRREESGPFTVIIGNPPFSGISTNNSPWIHQLLRGQSPNDPTGISYFAVDGQPLREKKLWLNDDYVKFFRYAQWLVDQNRVGMIAFVSNHGYLDNMTFRGMRQALLASFQRITIIDLHGNRKRHETTADGQPDHNLFGIAQGTAIGYFRSLPERVRSPDAASPPTRDPGRSLSRHDVWGTRSEKLEWLGSMANTPSPPNHRENESVIETGIDADDWFLAVDSDAHPNAACHPSAPLYSFALPDPGLDRDLPSGISLHELMPWHNSVPVTARDHLVIAFTEEQLAERLALLSDPQRTDEELRRLLFSRARSTRYPAGDTRGWKLPAARRRLAKLPDPRRFFQSCLYRPWDARVIFWADWMIDWPRSDFTTGWLEAGNWGIITRRQMLPDKPCNFFWVTNRLVIDGVLRSDNRGNEYLFPIYRRDRVEPFPKKSDGNRVAIRSASDNDASTHPFAYGKEAWSDPVANVSFHEIQRISQRLELKWLPHGLGDLRHDWGPEDMGYYLYALFHAAPYQRAYSQALRTGFPRALFPRDRTLLRQLHELGRQLTDCHLNLGSPTPSNGYSDASKPSLILPQPDSLAAPKVAPRYPRRERGRVWINDRQAICEIDEAVWDYRAGAHQVAVKWLADRRGQELSESESGEYRRILGRIAETVGIQRKLEEILGKPEIFRAEFE
jgi:hypothetical protein